MASGSNWHRALGLLADMLDYPGAGLGQTARECQEMVASWSPEAGELLGRFGDFVEAISAGELEEVYTGAMELETTSYPYMGYHLFGESYRRSVFMIELKEHYRSRGFDPGKNELPDHLGVLLRFLAMNDDDESASEIINEALLPVLGRMVGEVGAPAESNAQQAEPVEPAEATPAAGPYGWLLRALWLALQSRPSSAGAPQQGAYSEGGSADV